MAHPRPRSVALPGRGAGEVAALLRELTARLSAAPIGCGLLFEWRSPRSDLVVGAAGAETIAILQGTLTEWGAGGAGAPSSFPLPGRRVWLGRFASRDPIASEPPSRPSPALVAPPIPGPAPYAPSIPWVVQMHLFSVGALGEVQGSLRFGVSRPADPQGAGAADLAAHLGARLREAGTPGTLQRTRAGGSARREFRSGALGRFAAHPWFRWPADRIDRLAPRAGPVDFPGPAGPGEHVVMFGASGAGKTAMLADWAARAVRNGRSVVAFDLHGDLGPSIVARLAVDERSRLLALDVEDPGGPGLAMIRGPDARSRAHLVAALRRGSDDRGEVYWGFRLDRIFDVFVGLAAEEGGGLRDLYDLLTDERRREAARLSTRSPEAARFLDELRPILSRNPDFLWPAAARLSRLVGFEGLLDLLSPRAEGIDPEEILRDGRSLVIRIPIDAVGPEVAGLAATLLAVRLFLDRTGLAEESPRPVLFLFDEAQAFAPGFLTEVLAEGRKFGVSAVLATQFPGRLAEGLREAAAGTVSAHVVLRTPASRVRSMADWLGVADPGSVEGLSELPPGAALLRRFPDPTLRRVLPNPRIEAPNLPAWRSCVRETRRTYGSGEDGPERPSSELERVLRQLRTLELRPGTALRTAGGPIAAPETSPEIRCLVTHRWIQPTLDGLGYRVEPAGRAFLGERASTGAISESAAHRDLLYRAAELFAGQGESLEILRQGRFDTRLPDGRLRLLPPEPGASVPARTLERLNARRDSWAWRAFGGRDLHVEAEVTGADRRTRILRDLSKARSAGCHCLFLVGDPRRAARIRRVLREAGAGRTEATVWVLRSGASRVAATPPPDPNP